MGDDRPLRPPSWTDVAAAEARCTARTLALLARRRLTWPRALAGSRMAFPGGTSIVFRETVAAGPTRDPAVLVVEFTLRLLGTRPLPHALFRAESWLNTVLFAGFGGFRSKLWLTTPATGAYRGVYEWDGDTSAAFYADRLVRVLGLVSLPGTVRYHVVPGVRRDAFLRDPCAVTGGGGGWWSPEGPLAPGERPRRGRRDGGHERRRPVA